MITIVSGLPRSGTSLVMQMLKAGGWPIHFNREPNYDESNPRGYYEWEEQKSLWQSSGEKCKALFESVEGKAVKIFPQNLPCLSPAFKYQIIYIDRPLTEVIASQRWMQVRLKRDPNEIIAANLEKIRFHGLIYTRAFRSLVINYSELFNHEATSAIYSFLIGVERRGWSANNTTISEMESCVDHKLRHFR